MHFKRSRCIFSNFCASYRVTYCREVFFVLQWNRMESSSIKTTSKTVIKTFATTLTTYFYRFAHHAAL